jgi:hypothetical protein
VLLVMIAIIVITVLVALTALVLLLAFLMLLLVVFLGDRDRVGRGPAAVRRRVGRWPSGRCYIHTFTRPVICVQLDA